MYMCEREEKALQHNFKLSNDRVNIRLLYSKYQPQDGLMVVAYYHKLFQEPVCGWRRPA